MSAVRLTVAIQADNVMQLELLDMSTTFEQVDHQILLKWQHKTFGIHQDALKWICSYLSGRTQSIWCPIPSHSYFQLNTEYH